MILRSIIFDVLFYVGSFIYLTLLAPIMLVLPRRWLARPMFSAWTTAILWGLRTIVGLSWRVEGIENLKAAHVQGPVLLACKHQSAWETLIFSVILDDFAFVLKKELMWLPIFNLYLWKLRSVCVDRSRGLSALKSMIRQSKQRLLENHSLIIFPEGTRGMPGQETKLHPGVAALYEGLKIPVVPVALNSGLFWGRRSPYKKPGEIVIQFLPVIAPGLDRKEFMTALQIINNASLKLI